MVPYYEPFYTRTFFTKMYVKNKFGVKIWFLAFFQGHPFAFQVYIIKSDAKEEALQEQKVFPSLIR